MPGPFEIDSVERCRETVRVALTPLLAIADDVDSCSLHIAYRQ
jgi:hypothetical protein